MSILKDKYGENVRNEVYKRVYDKETVLKVIKKIIDIENLTSEDLKKLTEEKTKELLSSYFEDKEILGYILRDFKLNKCPYSIRPELIEKMSKAAYAGIVEKKKNSIAEETTSDAAYRYAAVRRNKERDINIAVANTVTARNNEIDTHAAGTVTSAVERAIKFINNFINFIKLPEMQKS